MLELCKGRRLSGRSAAAMAILGALAVALGCSSATPVHPDFVKRAPPAGGLGTVVVLRSGDVQVTDLVLQRYLDEEVRRVEVYTLSPTSSSNAILHAVEESRPAVVVTMGADATLFAGRSLTAYPLIFSLFLNYRARDFAHPAFAGITLELSPAVEFSMYKMVLPTMRSVLVFGSKGLSRFFGPTSLSDLAELGVSLRLVELDSLDDLADEYEQQDRADAVWLFNDPLTMTPDGFRRLVALTRASKTPLLCSTFEQFAEQGAFMAVGEDFENTGSQLARIVRQYLDEGVPLRNIGAIEPIGGRLVVNQAVGASLGFEIPPESLAFIARIITR